MCDKLFLIVDLDHVLSNMRRVARRGKQHHHLQLSRINLAIALIGKRDELIGNPDEGFAIKLTGNSRFGVEAFRPLMPVWVCHVDFHFPAYCHQDKSKPATQANDKVSQPTISNRPS
jgi:hypothetical protein